MGVTEFFNGVRFEFKKIVWPSYKEAWGACMLVFAFTAVASIFFFIVDALVYKLIQLVLGI